MSIVKNIENARHSRWRMGLSPEGEDVAGRNNTQQHRVTSNIVRV
jgi:hypothetical protein